MPKALAVGVSYETFKHLNPTKLIPFFKAYKQKEIMEDERAWRIWGNYGISALIFAIEHCLSGKKAKSEYIKEPIMAKAFENDGLTQEEIDEKEMQKMLFAEEMWIKNSRKKGLPETIIK